MAVITKEEKELRSERVMLLSQRKGFEGDLHDVNRDTTELAAAYAAELSNSLEVASNMKKIVKRPKAPRLERKEFADIVHKYLGTTASDGYKYCNVLGKWMPRDMKCAHIIPFSWNIKELGHMFGSDEPPLTSRRNGLSLNSKIEEAFDNCCVTIVPLDTVASTPTEWKLIVLNPEIQDNVFKTESSPPDATVPYKKSWKWKDIDGRKLTFLNDNRPARRFLYMRYILAWLHAEHNKWAGYKDKVPPGEVWASPNKPDGYLRKSILLDLAKMTGDRLPQDLMRAGAFEDPDTSSDVYDAIASERVAELLQNHRDGERDCKKGEDSDESSDEEDEDEEDE